MSLLSFFGHSVSGLGRMLLFVKPSSFRFEGTFNRQNSMIMVWYRPRKVQFTLNLQEVSQQYLSCNCKGLDDTAKRK